MEEFLSQESWPHEISFLIGVLLGGNLNSSAYRMEKL